VPGRGNRLRILFVLRALNHDRVFEHAVRALLQRGHEVKVVLEQEKRGAPTGTGAAFARLGEEFAGFSYEQLPAAEPGEPERRARELRLAIDWLRYLSGDYRDAPALRERARRAAPRDLVGLLDSVPLPPALSRRALAAVEARLPVPEAPRRLLLEHRPDVVLISPLVELGSAQVDIVRAASDLRIPSVLLVASWDNLTNKGIVKEPPTATIVWNPAQVEEAVRLHGIPRERVEAVGAHAFDHWFSWTPSTDGAAFAAKVGLDAGRPFLLYTCSSTFIARDEPAFVTEWIGRLRASGDETLREVGVVIRPHPQTTVDWTALPGLEPGRTVVWPAGGELPADERGKRDYYDSLFHSAAVVGVNTSALIEAAIVGRPVYTLLDQRFRRTQEGTLHFAHLSDDDGVLSLARDWDEHLAQLAAAVGDPAAHPERLDRFVARFVRPHGREVAAAPLLVDAVERAAARGATPRRRSARLVGRVWPLVPPAIALVGRTRRRGRRLRRRIASVRAAVRRQQVHDAAKR
jgi:hypothetical protein